MFQRLCRLIKSPVCCPSIFPGRICLSEDAAGATSCAPSFCQAIFKVDQKTESPCSPDLTRVSDELNLRQSQKIGHARRCFQRQLKNFHGQTSFVVNREAWEMGWSMAWVQFGFPELACSRDRKPQFLVSLRCWQNFMAIWSLALWFKASRG